jgi:hypothetical protein
VDEGADKESGDIDGEEGIAFSDVKLPFFKAVPT